MANLSAIIAPTNVVTTTGTETLSNKTLTAPTITGDATINAQGDLRFADADSSNYVALQAPATVTSNVTFTLPSADGTNTQVLQTNGSGVLSFVAAGGASAATPTVEGTVYGKMTASGGSPYLTALGYNAAVSSTGANNTAVGYQALNAATTAVNNCAVGRQAGLTATGGSSAYIGNQAGYGVTSGGGNVCLGSEAGYGATTLTTGSNNVYVGYAAAGSSGTNSGEVVVGCNIGSGLTGKGSSTAFISGNGGSTYNGANTTTFATTSDQRLKKNIADNNDGLNKINSIRVRNFEYRIANEVTDLPKDQVIKKTGLQLGVIAQELQAVLPECVKTESTGVLTVDVDNLTWYMINAIKQLKAEIDQLKGNV